MEEVGRLEKSVGDLVEDDIVAIDSGSGDEESESNESFENASNLINWSFQDLANLITQSTDRNVSNQHASGQHTSYSSISSWSNFQKLCPRADGYLKIWNKFLVLLWQSCYFQF